MSLMGQSSPAVEILTHTITAPFVATRLGNVWSNLIGDPVRYILPHLYGNKLGEADGEYARYLVLLSSLKQILSILAIDQ